MTAESTPIPMERHRQSARLWRRTVPIVILASLIILAFLYGPTTVARYFKNKASHALEKWAISSAQQWLDRAVRLTPADGELELLRAVCFRRWGEMGKWRRSMEAAESAGVPAVRVEREIALSLLRSGDDYPWVGGAEAELLAAGVAPDDVATTLLDHFLARGDYASAEQFLTRWQRGHADDSHLSYLWGFYWLQLQAYPQALDRFRETLEREPDHELARKVIAELLEMQGRIPEAVEQHAESLRRSPTSQIARLGLARALRQLNRRGQAQQLLDPLVTGTEPLEVAVREMGQLELESGHYTAAARWLSGDRPVGDVDPEQLLPAAIAAHLTGEPMRARAMIDRYEAVSFHSVRSYDLQLRVSIDPLDREASAELQRLQAGPPPPQNSAPDRIGSDRSARELYLQHCAACHGEHGGANGRGARHLFPRARNFLRERFRMVSTRNRAPTLDDVERVIEHGLPGTSMPAFRQLNEADRRLLATEVLRLHAEGLRTQFTEMQAGADQEPTEQEVLAFVESRTATLAPIDPPAIGLPSSNSLQRGREHYTRLGCHQCHGETGSGAADVLLFDDDNHPVRPRDLVHDPLKSGDDSAQLFLRIALGMPGTPHPAAAGVSDEELIELVHYCQSLSGTKQASTNHQRWIRASAVR